MSVASTSSERIDLLPVGSTPPKSPSDAGSEPSPSSSTVYLSSAAGTPDRNNLSNSFPNSNRDVDSQQSLASLRSEEYRQLFRLPPDEALVQDFNCAFQESILLQGHMYLFVHYICFYSNIFGFETKKIIHFNEITSVKRAKTAGLFPNAIEIIAGAKKYFFASFLSRDEAFKLITDGWLQQGDGTKPIADQQESLSTLSRSSSQENGLIVIDSVESFKQVNELDPNHKISDSPSDDPPLSANNQNGNISVTMQQDDSVCQDVEPTQNIPSSSPTSSCVWDGEDFDPPEVPGSYTKIAESKFPIKVEEFFKLFFSDNAVDFVECFHKGCGDKEFRCSSWSSHEKFGHVRNVFFQHPIKIYFGAKCGSCQEVQKYRVYRNSHLVIETSQEINDVPYGDHFSVEALWDVAKDGDESNEGCDLKIYINVAFTKRTVFRGKIVQSTVEECREIYGLWLKMAHELLKQKNFEKRQDEAQVASITQNGPADVKIGEVSESSSKSDDHVRTRQASGSAGINHQLDNPVQESFIKSSAVVSVIGECIRRLCLTVRNQSQVSLILVIAFLVIFLMQMSILVLLSRPQTVHLASPGEYYMAGMGGGLRDRSAETVAWLEKRMHHLKDEMLMVEARLERLQHEHSWLKTQLKDLEKPEKRK
ncbi:hypothetical protein K2173_011355 [Erythroxylum novogranatense]|uniref:VASt domain-containing protein n=1 Tax=Erythroxylum novogranatense TaxID=1862640 RepID=A0AAV8S9T4_9ROSI|nr:hypothetical protein K2173_011355 [Erythroxylum novogranatense]